MDPKDIDYKNMTFKESMKVLDRIEEINKKHQEFVREKHKMRILEIEKQEELENAKHSHMKEIWRIKAAENRKRRESQRLRDMNKRK